MDLNLILEAWIISSNPTKEQLELAEKRLKICDNCEFRKEIFKRLKIFNICSKCGCPITKKVFTNVYNPCPMRKWDEIDSLYFKDQKSKKTII